MTSSKLTEDILNIQGMSSDKVRHLLNNIGSLGRTYLEVGCWRGSTLISSTFQNNFEEITAIDNFSQYCNQEVVDSLMSNIEQYSKDTGVINFYNQDCFQFDLSLINKPVDVYFYDGDHTYDAQFKAIKYFYQVLNDECIIIVDDYNTKEAKFGTESALKETGLKVLERYELPARFNGDKEQYWNGILVIKVKK